MKELANLWAALPQLSNIHASADGKWGFFCQSGLNEIADIYALALTGQAVTGQAVPEQLTYGTDHHLIRDVSPDGRRLIVAQSVHANEHDHLMLLDRDVGNRLRLLTPKQDSHYVYGGVFSPDGGSVLFVTDYDYASEQVIDGGLVWVQDLTTGARRCLARTAHFFDTAPRYAPSGGRILLNLNDRAPGSTQLWVMEADGTNLQQVLCLGDRNNTRGDWIDDDHLGFVTDQDGRDHLGVLTLSSGAIAWLGSEPALRPFQVLPGRNGQFACIVHDQSVTRAVVVTEGRIADLPNTSGRATLLPHASLPDGGWLAEAYDASAPHDLVRVHPDGRCQSLLTRPYAGRTYQRPRDFRWTADDGWPCQGWLYQPQGDCKGLIAYIHGGPTWHSEDWVNPKIGFWVQAGFAVLDPNYRGSTGFGHDHREAVKLDGWGGREQGDIRAGVQALVAQGIAVPGKIGIAGNSYGGFSSWYAITRSPDLYAAAVPMCGMYRLDIDYHETEMPHGRAYSEEMMGGTPEQFPEKYANASPGNFIDQIKGDLLIVHGLADSNVGPENTHTAIRELTAAGIAHRSLLFYDEGHGIFRRRNVATYLAETAAFFAAAFARGGA